MSTQTEMTYAQAVREAMCEEMTFAVIPALRLLVRA